MATRRPAPAGAITRVVTAARVARVGMALCTAVLAATLAATAVTERWRSAGSLGGGVVLSRRMRGHDLAGGQGAAASHAPGHTPVSGHAAHTPSAAPGGAAAPKGPAAAQGGPHGAAGAKAKAPKPLTAAEKAKIAEQKALWRTEQTMKAKLDESDAAKENRLWRQTLSIVHKHDPNAALIAKLNKQFHLDSVDRKELASDATVADSARAEQQGPHSQPAARHVRGRSGKQGGGGEPALTQAKSDATAHSAKAPEKTQDSDDDDKIKNQLKANLESSVANRMHHAYLSIDQTEQKKLSLIAHKSQLASAAQAHSHESLHSMKQNLKSHLDRQTKQAMHPSKAKAEQSEHTATSKASIEQRLKAELDQKTKAAAKKLLQAEAARKRLRLKRRKLAGNMQRARRVREQLADEMTKSEREQDAIRSRVCVIYHIHMYIYLERARAGRHPLAGVQVCADVYAYVCI